MLDKKDAENRAAAFVKSWHDHCLREGRLDGILDKVAYKNLVSRVAELCESIATEFGASAVARSGRKNKQNG